jgi:hypothetical protein
MCPSRLNNSAIKVSNGARSDFSFRYGRGMVCQVIVIGCDPNMRLCSSIPRLFLC